MHENKINNKVYIGITSRKAKERWGYNGNGYYRNTHFYNSIKKYGWNNFEHIILAENLSKEQAEEMEIELIAKYNSTNRDKGYNIHLGGTGAGKCGEETRRKISESHKGLRPSDEVCVKLSNAKSGKNNPNYGKKMPEEHKQRLIALNTGRKKTSYEIERIIEAKGYIVYQYDLNGVFLNSFRSCGEASRITGLNKDSIKQCCNKNNHSAGNFIWRYQKNGYIYGENLESNDITISRKKKKVIQYSLDGQLISTYNSITEAANKYKVDRHMITECCNNKRESFHNYIWKFA